MNGRGPDWPHFVENNRHPSLSKLPGSLGTREAAADDMNGLKLTWHHSMMNKLMGCKPQWR